jgi:hypothetical protein
MSTTKTPKTPVAEALGRAHAALLEDLRRLEAAINAPSGKDASELAAGLTATRKHIQAHFRFEEDNGYLDAVRQREPRLERAIDQLANEHRCLSQGLDALITTTQSAAHMTDALRDGVRGWIEQVRQHETREDELVQDAFNLDINAED